jgi:hypothetical protein
MSQKNIVGQALSSFFGTKKNRIVSDIIDIGSYSGIVNAELKKGTAKTATGAIKSQYERDLKAQFRKYAQSKEIPEADLDSLTDSFMEKLPIGNKAFTDKQIRKANASTVGSYKRNKTNAFKAEQAKIKAENDFGGGFTGSEVDEMYQSSVGETIPESRYVEEIRQQNDNRLSDIFDTLSQNERQNQIRYSEAISNGTKYEASKPVIDSLAEEVAPPKIIQNDSTSQKILNGLNADASSGWVVGATEAENAANSGINRIKANINRPGIVRQIPLEETNTNSFNEIFKGLRDERTTPGLSVQDSLRKELGQLENPWSHGAKIALGTAVTGAALCAALSTSRGQQNNAQLYGQQPLY